MTPEDFDYNLGEKEEVATLPQWHNGNSMFEQLGGVIYTGGLIIEDKRMPEGVQIPGFTPAKLKLDRKDVNVIASTSVELAILGYRLRYFTGDGENRKFYARSQYEAAVEAGHKLRGNLQLAAYLKGYNRPVFASFSGTASSQIVAQVKEIREKGISHTAKEVNGERITMPLHGFWFTLTPTPHHLEGGEKKSEVTHPSLNLPEQFSRDYFLARYVGSANLSIFKQQFDSMASWFNAWEAK